MPALPPLSALRAFEAAARHLNMRLAAEELGVTHGAVAQQLRALEAHLGAALFERGPHGLVLTEAGRGLYPPARRAFALLADAVAAIRPARPGAEATVTVTVTPSFAARWLIPRLGGFASAAPGIEVRVLASERQEPLGRAGAPDLAVRQARPPFDAALAARLLLPIRLFPVCSPAVAAGLGALADLRHATLLHDAHSFWPLWLELAGAPAPQPAGRRFSHSALAVDAALDGQGIAIVPAPLVADDLARGRLVAPFGTGICIESEQSFYVVAPKSGRMPRAASVFRDWLVAQAAESGTLQNPG